MQMFALPTREHHKPKNQMQGMVVCTVQDAVVWCKCLRCTSASTTNQKAKNDTHGFTVQDTILWCMCLPCPAASPTNPAIKTPRMPASTVQDSVLWCMSLRCAPPRLQPTNSKTKMPHGCLNGSEHSLVVQVLVCLAASTHKLKHHHATHGG